MHCRRRAGRISRPDVKAYIKLKPDHQLTVDDLKAFLKDKLSKIEIPKLVEFRDELPKTLIGKLSRKAVWKKRRSGRPSRTDRSQPPSWAAMESSGASSRRFMP